MGANDVTFGHGFWFMGRLGYFVFGLGLVKGFGPMISFETEVQQATEAKQLDKIQQNSIFQFLPFQRQFPAAFTTKEVVSPYETHHRAI